MVTVSLVRLVSLLTIVTVAPGTVAPCGSLTTPTMLPYRICGDRRHCRQAKDDGGGGDDEPTSDRRFREIEDNRPQNPPCEKKTSTCWSCRELTPGGKFEAGPDFLPSPEKNPSVHECS